ncbi:BTAD domain-containing putative transcriptional regulator [Actinoplanes sp. NPDC049265]|uniref:AfsR/SARP family transcriptional regulator n=1 Tax=Actinoplanes sp. NPDC049265 TaxID=3363902 RepID=UPI003721D9DE
MEFRLLGEIGVYADGRPVDIGHTKQRHVLAALAVDAGRCVPSDVLIERVWGPAAPRRARDTARAYLCKLRPAVEPCDATIVRRAAGYLLAVDPLTVDLYRFRRLVADARTGGEATALGAYPAALNLWRGRPLGLLDTPWSTQLRAELSRERQSAERDHTDLLLAAGEHATVAGTLAAQATADPYDERLAAQLMLALYRCGRRADALAHYERVRRLLAGELGIDPGPALRGLHRQLLRTDPVLAAPPVAHERRRTTPRQLPPLPAAFTGRSGALSELDTALLTDGAGRAGRVAVIHGPGGIGKTWLALRWSHENAHRFPDGQLYLNLRGFDPGRDPVTPEAAVRCLLSGLGVNATAVPADPDSQVALYRSLLAGRRILLLLDDARTAAQVEPLLPGTASCATVITGRTRLAGLVAGHSARPVPLAVVDQAESAQVLARHLGAARLAEDPGAVAELIRYAAGLPLALGIVAGRAVLAPHLPLAAIVEDLRESSARLDGFDGAGLRTVLAASVEAVRPAAAELFGRLGSAPGPDIALPAVRHLAGLARAELTAALRELIDGHLVQEHRMGRYRLHDLVRLYAAEVGGDPAPVRERMFDYYAATTTLADRALYPGRTAGPGTVTTTIERTDAALWFEHESHNLLSCVAQAAECGADRHVLTLVQAMTTHLERRSRWHDREGLYRAAVRSAIRLGDPGAEAHARRGLAAAQIWLGAFDLAAEQLRIARDRFGAIGDRLGLAAAHRMTARMLARQGRHAPALGYDRRALALYRDQDDRLGQATVLNAIGWHEAHLGRPEAAIGHCRRALDILDEHDDSYSRGMTLDTLAVAHGLAGDRPTATTHFELALSAFQSCGDRFQEAETLRRFGRMLLTAGAAAEARSAWHRAVAILTDLGHPDADAVTRQLAQL